jgi:peptide/nickel transport system permease protein
VLSLALLSSSIISRLTRSGMLDVLNMEYVTTARAKGLAEQAVLYRHALKNALIPVITIVGLQFGALLGGAFVVETVFAWPGVGRLAVQALSNRDYPIIQGVVLFVSLIVVLVNLATDVLYVAIDPRVRA